MQQSYCDTYFTRGMVKLAKMTLLWSQLSAEEILKIERFGLQQAWESLKEVCITKNNDNSPVLMRDLPYKSVVEKSTTEH